ncbi:MAG: MBL fold metallo-hydrolase [Bryobacteraceae bacterium]|nr:MBL fold metallo-hydrolase [Bryobacteraceae bacterium]
MKRWTRRACLGGLGAAGMAGTATMVYRAAPRFWNQFVREWDRPILAPEERPNPAAWPDKGLHAAWLGHSTALIKADGFLIVTDPVFSDRAGIHLGPVTLGLKRLVAPAVRLGDLPKPDLILLSHAHMDHFDIPSLRKLEDNETSVVTAWATSDLLRPARYRAVDELRWGERRRVGPAEIQAFPVNHWGARVRSDTWRGYNGYLINVGRYRMLFAGDTADTHYFRDLKSSRAIDLAILPIGAYNPWIHYHCTPEQAWRMGNEAGGEFFIPVHHQTFSLSSEPVREPIERFRAAANSHASRIAIDSIGREFHL